MCISSLRSYCINAWIQKKANIFTPKSVICFSHLLQFHCAPENCVSFVFSFHFLSLLHPHAGFSTAAFPQSHWMDASSFKNSTFSCHLGVTESTLCLFFFSNFLHLQNHWNHWTSILLDMHIIMQTESVCNNTTHGVVERACTHLTAGRRLNKMSCRKEEIASQGKKVVLWVSVCVNGKRSTHLAINGMSHTSVKNIRMSYSQIAVCKPAGASLCFFFLPHSSPQRKSHHLEWAAVMAQTNDSSWEITEAPLIDVNN